MRLYLETGKQKYVCLLNLTSPLTLTLCIALIALKIAPEKKFHFFLSHAI